MPNITQAQAGSQPIADPNTASHRELADRLAYLAIQGRKLGAIRAKVNRDIAALAREVASLADAHIAATAREMAKMRRPK